MSEQHSCCNSSSKPKPFYKTLLFWAVILTAVFCGSSFFFPKMEIFRASFWDYASMMFWPMVIGLIAGGVLDHYVPQEYVSKHLAAHDKRAIFYSVGLGFLMSACSHGILALSMELHKKGASGPAVISFLLASPWANLPVTFLLISFFGAKGFIIILSALMISLITGIIFQFLAKKEWIEKNPHTVSIEPGFSIRADFKKRFRAYVWSVPTFISDAKGILKGSVKLADMIMGWVLLGALLASLIPTFVPEHTLHQWFGPTLQGLGLTLIFATVMEVCSEGMAPIAFEIYRSGKAFGNSFAYLMGGVVTDYTEIGLVWTRLGKKTALWMLAVTLPQVIILAWIYNHIF